ncbi:MAG TPA: hypothetical protein VF725_01625 [Ktedonobacterales bacterium]
MTQSAQQGSPSGMSTATERLRGGAEVVARLAGRSRTALAEQLGQLRGHVALLRSPLLLLPATPVLCATVLLYARGTTPSWGPVVLTLLSSALALLGVGALPVRRPLTLGALREAWRPQPRGRMKRMSASDRYATRLGSALLTLAVVCAAPLAFASRGAMWLLVGFALVVLLFYSVNGVRPLLTPIDEVIAALCLGPGMVALTAMAQRATMTPRDWLIAAAFGCMALGVLEGQRLSASPRETAQRGRTLGARIGPRRALLVAGGAMAVGFALAVALAVAPPTLPGALLALIAFPMALVALSGLGASRYAPSRQLAAAQLTRAYNWFGLALTVGVVATLIVQGFIGALVHSLIG